MTDRSVKCTGSSLQVKAPFRPLCSLAGSGAKWPVYAERYFFLTHSLPNASEMDDLTCRVHHGALC